MICFRDAQELVVIIIQARDLEPNQVTGTLDSYVKVWLCPSEQGEMQTKVSALHGSLKNSTLSRDKT